MMMRVRIKLGALVLLSRAFTSILPDVIPAMARAQQPATATTSLVFDRVTVVDVEQGKLLPAQQVVVTGNRIQSVAGIGAVKLPKDAQVVDARGKYLIPGLWDLHVHSRYSAPDFFYPLLLASGVTGIRDPGSNVPLDTLLQWRREIVMGKRVGPPRQILSGQYISEKAHDGAATPCHRNEEKGIETCVSSTPADARHLVDSLKAAGADMIKLYNVSHDMYFTLAAEARRIGIPFGGHIYSWVAITEASDSGLTIFDHRGNNNRSRELDSLCLEGSASVALCQPVASRFRQNGTWWVPTLIGLDQGGAASRSVLASVNEFSRAFWQSDTVLHEKWGGSPLASPSTASSPDSTVDSLGYLFRVMQLVSFPILAGTDVGVSDMREMSPGFSLHGELAMYVAEGLTPLNALQTATLNPAKMLHGTDSLGTVAPGKLADLVLLDANPLVNIANITTIQAVVANGRYFDRAALDQLLVEVKAKARQEPSP